MEIERHGHRTVAVAQEGHPAPPGDLAGRVESGIKCRAVPRYLGSPWSPPLPPAPADGC
jgi:hypothetical protein